MKCFVSIFIVAVAVVSCAQRQNDEPERVQNLSQQATVAVEKIVIPVEGMTCSACQSNVRRTIKNMDGVKDVVVSLKDRSAIVTYVPAKVKPEQIRQAITERGYKAGEPKLVKQ